MPMCPPAAVKKEGEVGIGSQNRIFPGLWHVDLCGMLININLSLDTGFSTRSNSRGFLAIKEEL